MSYEDYIEQLFSKQVLTEDDDGRLQLTDSYLAKVTEYRTTVDEGEQEWDELITETVTEEGNVQQILDPSWKQEDYLAHLLALTQYTDGAVDKEWLQMAAVLSQLSDPRPRAEGAPKAFLPIHGDWLDIFMDLFPNAVVYVWREDCDPCDLMKEKFDEIFDEPPDDVALFAIYGPEHAQFLSEAYDIAGGPATLFMLDGEVDVRLYGAHYRKVLDNEIATLRDLAYS